MSKRKHVDDAVEGSNDKKQKTDANSDETSIAIVSRFIQRIVVERESPIHKVIKKNFLQDFISSTWPNACQDDELFSGCKSIRDDAFKWLGPSQISEILILYGDVGTRNDRESEDTTVVVKKEVEKKSDFGINIISMVPDRFKKKPQTVTTRDFDPTLSEKKEDTKKPILRWLNTKYDQAYVLYCKEIGFKARAYTAATSDYFAKTLVSELLKKGKRYHDVCPNGTWVNFDKHHAYHEHTEKTSKCRCFLDFDLKLERRSDRSVNGQTDALRSDLDCAIYSFIAFVRDVLLKEAQKSVSSVSSVITSVCDASNSEKISKHAIFKTNEDTLMFETKYDVGLFVSKCALDWAFACMNDPSESIRDATYTIKLVKTVISCIDYGIYDKSGELRLPLCTKSTEMRPLRPETYEVCVAGSKSVSDRLSENPWFANISCTATLFYDNVNDTKTFAFPVVGNNNAPPNVKIEYRLRASDMETFERIKTFFSVDGVVRASTLRNVIINMLSEKDDVSLSITRLYRVVEDRVFLVKEETRNDVIESKKGAFDVLSLLQRHDELKDEGGDEEEDKEEFIMTPADVGADLDSTSTVAFLEVSKFKDVRECYDMILISSSDVDRDGLDRRLGSSDPKLSPFIYLVDFVRDAMVSPTVVYDDHRFLSRSGTALISFEHAACSSYFKRCENVALLIKERSMLNDSPSMDDGLKLDHVRKVFDILLRYDAISAGEICKELIFIAKTPSRCKKFFKTSNYVDTIVEFAKKFETSKRGVRLDALRGVELITVASSSGVYGCRDEDDVVNAGSSELYVTSSTGGPSTSLRLVCEDSEFKAWLLDNIGNVDQRFSFFLKNFFERYDPLTFQDELRRALIGDIHTEISRYLPFTGASNIEWWKDCDSFEVPENRDDSNDVLKKAYLDMCDEESDEEEVSFRKDIVRIDDDRKLEYNMLFKIKSFKYCPIKLFRCGLAEHTNNNSFIVADIVRQRFKISCKNDDCRAWLSEHFENTKAFRAKLESGGKVCESDRLNITSNNEYIDNRVYFGMSRKTAELADVFVKFSECIFKMKDYHQNI